MSQLVRTTITLPADLYEQLRVASFYQRKPISQLIREGAEKILPQKKNVVNLTLKKIEGKYNIVGKKGQFDRPKFYDKLNREKMPD